jgi:hypothetical protein
MSSLDNPIRAAARAARGAIEQGADERRGASQSCQEGYGLRRRQHHRHVRRTLCVDEITQPLKFVPKYLLVQEQQSGQRLILCRRGDLRFRRERRQECAYLELAHGLGMALAVK